MDSNILDQRSPAIWSLSMEISMERFALIPSSFMIACSSLGDLLCGPAARMTCCAIYSQWRAYSVIPGQVGQFWLVLLLHQYQKSKQPRMPVQA
jgi:hypothetical protein